MSRPPAKRTPPPPANSGAEEAWAAKMERLRRRAPARSHLRVCLDDELRRKAEEADQAAGRAQFLAEASPGDELPAVQARQAKEAADAARAEADEVTVVLTFQALPRPEFEELISGHPPTDAQSGDGAIFNPDTFPAALVAAASVDGMSEADAGELLATWSTPEANQLWEAAWRVQQESRVELGKG
jgi:hypothetical protein